MKSLFSSEDLGDDAGPACKKCGGATRLGPGTDMHAASSRCLNCGAHRWLSKAAVGERPRTIDTTRRLLREPQRARILDRALGRCETCGLNVIEGARLEVGHVLSLKDGHDLGANDDELNDDENLCAMCTKCNSDLGARSLSPRHALQLLRARLRGPR